MSATQGGFFTPKNLFLPSHFTPIPAIAASSATNESCSITLDSEAQSLTQVLKSSKENTIQCDTAQTSAARDNSKNIQLIDFEEFEKEESQEKVPFDRVLSEIKVSVNQKDQKDQILDQISNECEDRKKYEMITKKIEGYHQSRDFKKGSMKILEEREILLHKTKMNSKHQQMKEESIIPEEEDSEHSKSSDRAFRKEQPIADTAFSSRVSSNRSTKNQSNQRKEENDQQFNKNYISKTDSLKGGQQTYSQTSTNSFKKDQKTQMNSSPPQTLNDQIDFSSTEIQNKDPFKQGMENRGQILVNNKKFQGELKDDKVIPASSEQDYQQIPNKIQSTIVKQDYQNLINSFKQRTSATLNQENNTTQNNSGTAYYFPKNQMSGIQVQKKSPIIDSIHKKIEDSKSIKKNDYFLVKTLQSSDCELSKYLPCQQSQTHYLEETGDDFIFRSSEPERGEKLINTGSSKYLSGILAETIYSGQESNQIYLVNSADKNKPCDSTSEGKNIQEDSSEKEQLKREIVGLLRELEDASEEIKSSQDQMMNQANKIEIMESLLNQLREELRQKQQQIDIKDSQVNSLFREREVIKTKKKELKNILQQHQDQFQQTKIELKQTLLQLDSTKQQLQQLQSQNNSSSSIYSLRAGLEEKDRFIAEQVEYFKSQQNQFQDENSLLKQEIAALQRHNAYLQRLNSNLQEEVQSRKQPQQLIEKTVPSPNKMLMNDFSNVNCKTHNSSTSSTIPIPTSSNRSRVRSYSQNEQPPTINVIDSYVAPSNSSHSSLAQNRSSSQCPPSSSNSFIQQNGSSNVQHLRRSIQEGGVTKSTNQLRRSYDSYQAISQRESVNSNYQTEKSNIKSSVSNTNPNLQSNQHDTPTLNQINPNSIANNQSPISSKNASQQNSQISYKDSSCPSSGINANKSQASTSYNSRNEDSNTNRLSHFTPNSQQQQVKTNNLPINDTVGFCELSYPKQENENVRTNQLQKNSQQPNQGKRVRSFSNLENSNYLSNNFTANPYEQYDCQNWQIKQNINHSQYDQNRQQHIRAQSIDSRESRPREKFFLSQEEIMEDQRNRHHNRQYNFPSDPNQFVVDKSQKAKIDETSTSRSSQSELHKAKLQALQKKLADNYEMIDNLSQQRQIGVCSNQPQICNPSQQDINLRIQVDIPKQQKMNQNTKYTGNQDMNQLTKASNKNRSAQSYNQDQIAHPSNKQQTIAVSNQQEEYINQKQYFNTQQNEPSSYHHNLSVNARTETGSSFSQEAFLQAKGQLRKPPRSQNQEAINTSQYVNNDNQKLQSGQRNQMDRRSNNYSSNRQTNYQYGNSQIEQSEFPQKRNYPYV